MVTTRAGTRRQSGGVEAVKLPYRIQITERQELLARPVNNGASEETGDVASPGVSLTDHQKEEQLPNSVTGGREIDATPPPVSKDEITMDFLPTKIKPINLSPTAAKDDHDHPSLALPTNRIQLNTARDSIPETAIKALPQEAEEGSDDEAPEAISTVQAASHAKEAARAAQKAATEQATQLKSQLKRKRQERDALFKKQAEVRKQAQTSAPRAESTRDIASRPAQPRGRIRAGKIQVPELLPPEFLSDSSGAEEDKEEARNSPQPNAKRRKGSSYENEKALRDIRAGSALYRVERKTDESLPPKKNVQASKYKGRLLLRGRKTVGFRKGFLRNSSSLPRVVPRSFGRSI